MCTEGKACTQQTIAGSYVQILDPAFVPVSSTVQSSLAAWPQLVSDVQV